MIKQYLRDKSGRKRGVVVATGAGQVGWSLTHPADIYNNELAHRIAEGRAQANVGVGTLPREHHGVYQAIEERSRRYFK